MSEALLSLLKPGETTSGETLARRLKITRQGLHKQILSLRKRGVQIEGKPNSGYKLLREPDVLSLEKISKGLETKIFGKVLVLLERTDSTQDKAKELAEAGCPEGTTVIAEEQSRGRGRLGRPWVSGRGGLWVSVVLRPRMPPQNVPLLALAASVAIARAIESACRARCFLKWPNDILIPAGKGKKRSGKNLRKVCGSLIEMTSEPDRIRWLILGFGIDVNNPTPASLQDIALSLKEAQGGNLDRNRILRAVLQSLDGVYESLLSKGFEWIRKEYMKRSVLKRGARLALSDHETRIQGRLVKIAQDGALVLALPGGKQEKFYAGDVTV